MIQQRRFICTGCPIGCPLQLDHDGHTIVEVSGQECDRGAKYAATEFKDPRRSLSTTVPIRGAQWSRLPVKVTVPIPKDHVMEAARIIHGIVVEAPITIGLVLLSGLLGDPEADVVATRSMERRG